MLERLLNPQGVAIIGASQNPTKLGYGAARNLVVSGYGGAIHLVNPKGGELFGLPIYPSPAEVPDPVDLAVVLVPAPVVPGVLEACGQRGFGAVIIGAGGFREKGPEGAELEEQCLQIAQSYGMRVLGPNCIGFLDTHLPIDTSFLPLPGPIPGDITFLSHSGAICEAVIDWARGQGFGLARLVSLGNQMDLTETELLSACVDDPETSVVAMYLEGVSKGREFIEQAARAVQQKPVVAIKVGRSARGSQAVASHTGALAGEDAAYSAAFDRAGILRAKTSEEMFDWARALAWAPLPEGRRVAILTNAGGPGAIAVDALYDLDLSIADLSEQTQAALAALLPPEASVQNPVDMVAGAGPSQYARCLDLLLQDEGVDSVMIILPPPPMSSAADVAGALLPLVKSSRKPIVVALMGEELIAHAAQLFRQAKVPEYRFPERAASALYALSERAEQIRRPAFDPPAFSGIEQEAARQLLLQAEVGGDGFIDVEAAYELLRMYGIPVPQDRIVHDAEAVVSAAAEIGYPLVMKIGALQVVHKSDVGGVILGLQTADEVLAAFEQLKSSAAENGITEQEFRVQLQAMAPDGLDLIIGVRRDPQFGPLAIFGAGGIDVELRRDISFGLAPLDKRESEAMIDSTLAGKRLAGLRGEPELDRAAVVEALLRLSKLACDHADLIAELEVNPLRALEKGTLALDVRLRQQPT